MAMRIYVSSEEAAFFNNNKMGYADSIPTSGSYKVGDFIISSTQLDGIFGWVCTEEGTPGKWEVIGSGASGGGKLVSINASKVIDTAVNQISLTELGLAVDSKDKLIVHFNSMFLMEGVDYQISADGSMITKLGGGNWNESNIAGCLFTFELLKNVENVDTEEIKLDSKLICEKNNVTVIGAVSEVNIGISGFNKSKDTLIVYKNATYLIEGVDYEVSSDSSKIVSLNGIWNESAESDYIFTFVVFKEVATINPEAVVDTTNIVNGSVTMDKLSDDVKQAIENASNIDLSGYALKADVGDKARLQTTAKDSLVGAINELFQNANNGKELIATAIGEPLTAEDTFSAMSTGINNLNSQFKSALMNNGVSVESADKFKSLIEKLALLADSEGKGIQYASGNGSSFTGTNFTPTIIPLNIDFNPTIFIILTDAIKIDGTLGAVNTTINNIYHTSSDSSLVWSATYNSKTWRIFGYLQNLTNESVEICLDGGPESYGTYTGRDIVVNDFTWYAIGVGEEDTTLLDSLKSILQDESVEVTDEDDMASLIVKTDNEFTNKNNEIASNKQALVNALNSKGVEITGEETYDELVEIIKTYIPPTLILYDNGYINTDIVGSFDEMYNSSVSGTTTVTMEDTCINVTVHSNYTSNSAYVWGGFYSNLGIDTTNYRAVHVEYSRANTIGNLNIGMDIDKTVRVQYNTTVNFTTPAPVTSINTHEIATCTFTPGTFYLTCFITSTRNNVDHLFTIHKIWLDSVLD